MDLLQTTRRESPASSLEERRRLAEIPVLVLAGGLGTRLRSVYDAGPKVMAPIAGKPFVSYLLGWLRASGFFRIVLCVGYKREQVEEFVGDGSSFGLSVGYSIEPTPLGTAGALRLAAESLAAGCRFFALNGDSISQVDFAGMLRSHESRRALATVVLFRKSNAGRYGRVEIAADNQILEFFEKDPAAPVDGFINAGIYVFERDAIAAVPAACEVSLERDVLPQFAGNNLFAFRADGYFIDIGIPEDLARAQAELDDVIGTGHQTRLGK
jgi:NDP-sugar pyrophosphorylase family protein